MTDNLFPGYDDFMADKEAGSQRVYEVKILKKIYEALHPKKQFLSDRRAAGEDFGLDWYNDTGSVSITLFAKSKIVVNPIHVLRAAGFTKTKLWDEFFFVKNRLSKGTPVAMFFPIIGMTQFVIHNASFLEMTPGTHIVLRQGRTADMVLKIETMAGFIAALATRFGE